MRLFFQPFEEIKIVTIGVAKAYHSCTPTLIRRLAVENQPFRVRFLTDAVNVRYLKTYMVDSQRIFKVRPLFRELDRVLFIFPARNDEIDPTSAPPQLEPAPAVHPKQ